MRELKAWRNMTRHELEQKYGEEDWYKREQGVAEGGKECRKECEMLIDGFTGYLDMVSRQLGNKKECDIFGEVEQF